MSTWMVTGGAGYIGAHVVRAFAAAGIHVVVVDDLSTGHPSFIPDDCSLHRGSVLDSDLLTRVIRYHHVTGVVHLAAFKYAGVSVDRPLHTYEQNVEGTRRLLKVMHQQGVRDIVFSSSAAVYGTPETETEMVTEETPTRPESPYGESKLVGEWLLRDVARVTDLRHTSLRYFNVIGSGHPDVYDASPHNLVPLVLKALTDGETPKIFGGDYPTPDGTCVRDYVHVGDLADAHVAAATALAEDRPLAPVYNCGSGAGMSVAELMAAVKRATGNDFTPEVLPRRAGDPPRIVADGAAAARDLGWRMSYSVDEMVLSAWRAWLSAAATSRPRPA